MRFGEFVALLLASVPEDCYDYEVSFEKLDNRSRMVIDIEVDDVDHDYTPYVRIVGQDMPYEQFPNGVGPRNKPYHWDEYKNLLKKGYFPPGHEEVRL